MCTGFVWHDCMGFTAYIVTYATYVIDTVGYVGVFALMVLESMVVPVPSEAVLPFAGFLIAEGRFSFVGVVVASTCGSIFGSLLSYAMGRYGGKPMVERWGRYLLLDRAHLEATIRFFERRGAVTIFVSRFIPVVRHLISIPAGIGMMPLVPFVLYTAVGAALWNGFLTWCGIVLAHRWETLMAYSHAIDIVVVCALMGGGVYAVYHYLLPTRGGDSQGLSVRPAPNVATMERMDGEEFEKIKIGWFVFSCSEDSTIMFTELMNDHWAEWKRIFDFRHVKVLKKNNIFDEFDIAFVEGAIASPEHETRLKDIRGRSKKLVAIGACAVTGLPASQRNTFTEAQKEATQFLVDRFGALPEVKKVADVVAVDASVPGCPMNTDLFLKAVHDLILELRPNGIPT